jgi:hypothetical protein
MMDMKEKGDSDMIWISTSICGHDRSVSDLSWNIPEGLSEESDSSKRAGLVNNIDQL